MIVSCVRSTIAERSLLSQGDGVLVACSGGADSGAMLHALTRLAPELDLSLFAASVDHGLRPESGRDVEVARELSKRLEVRFAALRVEVPPGPSRQAHARDTRYEALREEAARRGASRIAVGHTLDDQAETVLGRILRGSGTGGLGGISPRREDGVVRPLIDCRRSAVRAHAVTHALPFVDDPSNLDATYERVRLRHRLLPLLEEEDPRLVEHLAGLADEAREVRELLRTLASDVGSPDTPEGLEALRRAAGPVRRQRLALWVRELTGRAAKRSHLEALDQLLRSGRGEVLLGAGWLVRATVGGASWESSRAPRRSRSHRGREEEVETQ